MLKLHRTRPRDFDSSPKAVQDLLWFLLDPNPPVSRANLPSLSPCASVYLLFLSSDISPVQAQNGRLTLCTPTSQSPLFTPSMVTPFHFPTPSALSHFGGPFPRMQLLCIDPGSAGRDHSGGSGADAPHCSGCLCPGPTSSSRPRELRW